jgi:hypothetical protein
MAYCARLAECELGTYRSSREKTPYVIVFLQLNIMCMTLIAVTHC